MIIGNPEIFAIDYEIEKVVDSTDGNQMAFGSFLLRFGGYAVGNPKKQVILGTCIYALQSMLEHKIEASTAEYSHMTGQELLSLFKTKSVVDLSKFSSTEDAIQSVQAMSRDDFNEGMDLYHFASIETIGSCSFDQVYILMIDDKPGFKRFVIQQEDDPIREFIVETASIVKTVRKFISSCEKDVRFVDLRTKSQAGDAKAQIELGKSLFYQSASERENEEMIQCFQAAADQGDAEAFSELGRCYILGRGVSKDVNEATRLYRIAAEKGNVRAMRRLGACYRLGSGVVQDMDEGRQWFERAEQQRGAETVTGLLEAASGPPGTVSSKAQYLLAKFYMYGYTVEKNYEKAKEWTLKASSQNNQYSSLAEYNLGELYLDGPDDIRNVGEGIRWLRKSASRGYWQARLRLGCCYAEGKGVPKDDRKAARYFRQLAEEGEPEAMFRLGLCFHEGKGVKQDREAAVLWMQKAADCGAGYDEAKEWLKHREAESTKDGHDNIDVI